MATTTKTKSFRLYGQSFTPLRKFTKLEEAIHLNLPLYSIGISAYKDMRNSISSEYDYDEFYKKATKIGAGEIDIFLMNGKTEVIPATNEIFEYIESDLKYPNSERKTYFS